MSSRVSNVMHLRTHHLLDHMRRQLLLLLLLLTHRNRLLRELLVVETRPAAQDRRKPRATETQELILLRYIRPTSEFHPIH